MNLIVDYKVLAVPAARELIKYAKCHTLPELIVFLANLSTYLDSHPKVLYLRELRWRYYLLLNPHPTLKTALLVLNSLSFPLQYGSCSFSTRAVALEQIKERLNKTCAAKNLTVRLPSQSHRSLSCMIALFR